MACLPPPVSYSDPRDLGQVHDPLKSILWTAQLHRPAGTTLFLVSGRRTDWMQWLLRHERTPGHECGPMSQFPGHPTTALVGTSNHRNISDHIAAADMGGTALDWLGQHETEFGLHRPVRGEKWHFERNWAIQPTMLILPYGSHGGDHPVEPNAGRHWIPIRPDDTDGIHGTVYAREGLDNEVAEAQVRLGKRGFYKGKIDGIFGPQMAQAVSDFKVWAITIQQAFHKPVWPNHDPIIGAETIRGLRAFTA